MKKLSYLSLLILLVSAFTAFAQGNGATTSKWEYSGAMFNECCEEWVLISGTVHDGLQSYVKEDGSVGWKYHLNLSGMKGVGQSTGIAYNLIDNIKESISSNVDDFSVNHSLSRRMHFVGKGKGGKDCSGVLVWTVHFVRDADGNVVIDHYSYEWECADGTLS